LDQKLTTCGTAFKEYYSLQQQKMVDFPLHCNNRSCTNPECKKHRGYLFTKEHRPQINFIDDNTKRPKAIIFTGWVFKQPTNSQQIEYIRKFAQTKMVYLCLLLQTFSLTPYSVHMEFKLKPNGNIYLHYHVVAGYINRLKLVRQRWGRQILYEDAHNIDNLNYYISKYASKTPYFHQPQIQQIYHLLVYKTQMHRFSERKQPILPQSTRYLPIEQLEREAYYTMKQQKKGNTAAFAKFIKSYLDKQNKIETSNLKQITLGEET